MFSFPKCFSWPTFKVVNLDFLFHITPGHDSRIWADVHWYIFFFHPFYVSPSWILENCWKRIPETCCFATWTCGLLQSQEYCALFDSTAVLWQLNQRNHWILFRRRGCSDHLSHIVLSAHLQSLNCMILLDRTVAWCNSRSCWVNVFDCTTIALSGLSEKNSIHNSANKIVIHISPWIAGWEFI